MFDELKKQVQISGWGAGWVTRKLPAFQYYANGVSYALALGIFALGLIGFFGIRRCTKELKENPSARAAIFKKINKRIIKICRGHWAIANIYLFNVIAIGIVDAYVGITAMKDEVAQDPSSHGSSFWLQTAAYVAIITALFVAVLTIVPLLQMISITWLLTRFARKHGVTSLSNYLTEARMYSTHIAQIWTIISFFIMAWWEPGNNTLARWLVLEACIGSSFAWLDASFAFNFCYKRLGDQDLELKSGGVTDLVRLFGKTVKAAHSIGEKEALPRYEDVPQKKPNAIVDEKTPLTTEDTLLDVQSAQRA